MMLRNNDETAYRNEKNASGDLVHNLKVSSSSFGNGMKPMPSDFQPGRLDVICARGKKAQNHYGNLKFRETIEKNLEAYSNASTKVEKSLIVTNIVDQVREESPDGGFVKEEGGRWYEVGDHIAREKVGQGMRDLLHTKYKSSHKSKKRRRKADASKLDYEVDEFLHTHCEDIMHRMQKISMSADSKTDDELQKLLNDAQSDLLQVLKNKDLKSIFDKYSSKQSADIRLPVQNPAKIERSSDEDLTKRVDKRSVAINEESNDEDGITRGNKRRRKVYGAHEDTMLSLLTAMAPLSQQKHKLLGEKNIKEETPSLQSLPEMTTSLSKPTLLPPKLPKLKNKLLIRMDRANNKQGIRSLVDVNPLIPTVVRRTSAGKVIDLENEMMKERISLDLSFVSGCDGVSMGINTLDPLFRAMGKVAEYSQ